MSRAHGRARATICRKALVLHYQKGQAPRQIEPNATPDFSENQSAVFQRLYEMFGLTL